MLLAEDQATVRDALATLLGLQPDLAVVAAVGRGDEVVAAALRTAVPACRVLILTTFGRPGYLRRAMQSGAVGFLVKEAPAAPLAVAIRRAVAGERVVDPALAAAALTDGDSPLTDRERQVLAEAARGGSVAAIAAALFLTEGTVRNYLSEAIQKVGARNRAEAARLAEERGWL